MRVHAKFKLILTSVRNSRYTSSVSNLSKPTQFVFIGAPGVGKGTFANMICKQKGWSHYSLGDLLRLEVSNETSVGSKIKNIMASGLLVPDEIANEVLLSHLRNNKAEGFILDGYPRTAEQARYLDSNFKGKKGCKLVAVNITLTKWVAVEKLLARQICSTCGSGFNSAHIMTDGFDMPGIFPQRETCVLGAGSCRPVLVSRSDDTKEVVERRFEEYDHKTRPVLAYYLERNALKSFEVHKGIRDTPGLLEFMQQPITVK